MSHSEWEVIKLKKAKVDSRKNAIYTRHARAIMVAARQGEPDPDANFALRAAIEKARQAGLPNENIERAIKKGAGLLEETDLEALQYEGYGPGGVAILMEILTDNRNRTASEVREAFSKVGCSLGETGCVSWMFDHKGVITLQGSLDEEALLLAAAEAGGEDVHFQDNSAT
ncbi:MAG: YebC/PmpR family DNA-binding transcriptional regulator, partial [Thermostichales cyanobacterium SRBZ-1_bins_19]